MQVEEKINTYSFAEKMFKREVVTVAVVDL